MNATGYGLTSGLESLDDREQELWPNRIRAGNLYINRPTTGAIVLRQPFGGMGKSSVGPGIKAGGPNYVVPLMYFGDKGVRSLFSTEVDEHLEPVPEKRDLTPLSPDLGSLRQALQDGAAGGQQNADVEVCRILAAIGSYQEWARSEFRVAHDHFRLLGEDNFRRYLPVEPLRIRIHPDDTFSDVFCRAAAARAAGCRAIVSVPPSLKVGPPSRGGQDDAEGRSARGHHSAPGAVALLDRLTDSWAGAIEFIEEDDASVEAAIRLRQVARLRYADPSRVPKAIRIAAAEACSTWPIRRCRCTAGSSCCGISRSRAYRTCTIGTATSACEPTSHALSPRDRNRRGLAHFAESSEQNVPVPLARECFGRGGAIFAQTELQQLAR